MSAASGHMLCASVCVFDKVISEKQKEVKRTQFFDVENGRRTVTNQ